MDWTEIKITSPVKFLEQVSSIITVVAGFGIYIEDYSDLEIEAPKIANVDLIDEELLAKQKENSIIHIYLSPDSSLAETISFIGHRLSEYNIPFEVETNNVKEQDWATAWKKYYHPISLTDGLAICPSWEKYTPKPNQKVIKLDPGMAFGTGTHDTTQLCLKLMEPHLTSGKSMLDIGCGSGILAIAARLLRNATTIATDIDPHAVKVARENAELNEIYDIDFICTDLVTNSIGTFDVICANIVADVIIRLAPSLPSLMRKDAVFVASGIIEQRKDEVLSVLLSVGLKSIEILESRGWVAITCEKA